MLSVEVQNTGSEEVYRPRFKRMLQAACVGVKELGIVGDDQVIMNIKGPNRTNGPLQITVQFNGQGAELPVRAKLAKELGETAGRFYFEHGWPPRPVKVVAGDACWPTRLAR